MRMAAGLNHGEGNEDIYDILDPSVDMGWERHGNAESGYQGVLGLVTTWV